MPPWFRPLPGKKGEQAQWDYEADVVVIGAGGSGLPAGLKALEDGASVIMVEANYDCGGHAAVSEGQLHSGGYTVSQKEWDVTDSSDRYYYDHTRGFLDSRYNDREVTRSVANSIAEAYDFVLKKGIVVQDIEPMIQAYYRDGGYDADGVARMTYVDATEWENDITGRKNNGIGDVALKKLVAQAKEKKSAEVDIVTGASITSAAFIEALTNALDKIK